MFTFSPADFYQFVDNFFYKQKDLEDYFVYKEFRISKFRGLDDVSLSFSRNNLVLLLGLNESGKTTILKAIESFDYLNDPNDESLKSYFSSIRNKQDISCDTPTIITATININKKLDYILFRKALSTLNLSLNPKREVEDFLEIVNKKDSIKVSRVIPFQEGNAKPSYYQIESNAQFSDQRIPRIIAQEIVRRCPYIFYFEDFQDLIPEKIYTRPNSEAFNRTWYEIIDGLFYNTDPSYNIKKFLTYYSHKNRREYDARTVLNQVNQVLHETFTLKWRELSGVQDIEDAQLTFNEDKKYFEIVISEKDGTTYSVYERSKGAVWYLAFLMKTEFRRKKLRGDTGKPVYLIDEPASNLHSTAQENMIADFYKLVEDTSVIYTTHSRYLISSANIKNTHVVIREKGVISCTRWGDYIKGKSIKISYFQPLADLLKIVPNSLDVPWCKALLTEGPSDANVLITMYKILNGKDRDFVVYPGSSANNLSTLISLNIGWGSKFYVVLDSDKAGRDAKEKYQSEFDIDDDYFVMLPGEKTKIEGMFSEKEKNRLYELIFEQKNDKKVSKKEFAAIFGVLSSNNEKLDACKNNGILNKRTLKTFETLFKTIDF